MWARSEMACLTIRSDNHRGSVRGTTVREVCRLSGRCGICQGGVVTVREGVDCQRGCIDCQRGCIDCQRGVATVREVWHLLGRCGGCQRGVTTVREVWRVSGRCGNCKGGVATDIGIVPLIL